MAMSLPLLSMVEIAAPPTWENTRVAILVKLKTSAWRLIVSPPALHRATSASKEFCSGTIRIRLWGSEAAPSQISRIAASAFRFQSRLYCRYSIKSPRFLSDCTHCTITRGTNTGHFQIYFFTALAKPRCFTV